ncbi:hypothetical protein TIFTF001_043951 [Ficus carica]|uniref:NB-ARC domain-containing protein n=1 Tax=Ficus carica TaxID=3494 RepID=A0AA88CQY0_FICCA|nr:hypothetical protein TIFTF001_043951 [Ficus carica]
MGSSSDKISVIPVVGMGDIGKTTLAQLFYEDKRVKSQFHIRSWVVVSDESDISIIAKKKSLKRLPHRSVELTAFINFNLTHGSRIIVTTRSDIIAKKIGNVPAHHLEKIPDNDCWKLFGEHPGQRRKQIEDVGNEYYQDLLRVSALAYYYHCRDICHDGNYCCR